jgi:hypothetical protein
MWLLLPLVTEIPNEPNEIHGIIREQVLGSGLFTNKLKGGYDDCRYGWFGIYR